MVELVWTKQRTLEVYLNVAEFGEAIAVKRNEMYEAFSRRRDALAAEKTAKIDRLAESALRVLDTVQARAATLADRAAIEESVRES